MLKTNLLLPAIVLVQLGLVLALFMQRRAQKAVQDRIVAALPHGIRFWRVALSHGSHLSRVWRLGPVQSLGVLVDEGTQVRLTGRWRGADTDFEVVLPKLAPHQPQWRGPYSLRAGQMAWASFPCPEGDVMVAVDTGLQTLGSREALADMLRSVYPDLVLPDRAGQEFALEKHKGTLLAMGLMLALFVFAIVDTFVISRFELIDAQIAQLMRSPVVLASYGGWLLLVGVVVFAALRKASVPPRESYGLAILMALAVALATPPVIKRVAGVSARIWEQRSIVDNPAFMPTDVAFVLITCTPPRSDGRNSLDTGAVSLTYKLRRYAPGLSGHSAAYTIGPRWNATASYCW